VSGDEPRVLKEEQAALRRVATLVARGIPPQELFDAVTREVMRLLPVEFAIMGRYESDGELTALAVTGSAVDSFPAGSRRSLGENNVSTLVFATGRPARIDAYPTSSSGAIGAAGRAHGVRSAVGTPIIVEGRTWGVMIVGSVVAESSPVDIEARLANFTELVATAIANAESLTGLARLAEEQAALRRVATLVARGAAAEEVCAAVTEEVGMLLPVEFAIMGRFEADATVTSVAAWGAPVVAGFPAGSRWGLEGRNLVTTVLETGRPVRVDGFEHSSGPIGAAARAGGFRSTVGTPIVVASRVWGVMCVGSTVEDSLPADLEARLASFTELVATAIASGESRAALGWLAEEQAALRRVATLVARGVPPGEVFAAVTKEVGQLFHVDHVALHRYRSDGAVTDVDAWTRASDLSPALVSRARASGKSLAMTVFETGRPARMDRHAEPFGVVAMATGDVGVRSAVASPIIVEGRVWGAMWIGSILAQQPLAADTEARLASFSELVATAIANAESLAALAASRARIAAASDDSRRRIERDLHEGAEQRLVKAVNVLTRARSSLVGGDGNVAELAAEALRHAEDANLALRELAHEILPSGLTRGGLPAGVEALVSRISLPVDVDVSIERLPIGVEATAYFVISEALTNIVKHARAARAEVSARIEGGLLRVEVCDDGVGGAHVGLGTGLGGLTDRLAVLDGTLQITSPSGGGTTLRAEIPLGGHRGARPPASATPTYSSNRQ
jgi:GAF domain-containing protein